VTQLGKKGKRGTSCQTKKGGERGQRPFSSKKKGGGGEKRGKRKIPLRFARGGEAFLHFKSGGGKTVHNLRGGKKVSVSNMKNYLILSLWGDNSKKKGERRTVAKKAGVKVLPRAR